MLFLSGSSFLYAFRIASAMNVEDEQYNRSAAALPEQLCRRIFHFVLYYRSVELSAAGLFCLHFEQPGVFHLRSLHFCMFTATTPFHRSFRLPRALLPFNFISCTLLATMSGSRRSTSSRESRFQQLFYRDSYHSLPNIVIPLQCKGRADKRGGGGGG